MTYNYVLDSSAWIEYFRGTKKGELVEKCLGHGKTATPAIVLGELSDFYTRGNKDYFEKDLLFISSKTSIIDLSAEIAIDAGKIKNAVRRKYKNNFGLADAVILATARKFEAQTVTSDSHFKGLKETIFLE